MSIFAVNKLCRQALHDIAFREALTRDPKSAIASLTLTEDERAALLSTSPGFTSAAHIRSCWPI
jgi:hypothetical protein